MYWFPGSTGVEHSTCIPKAKDSNPSTGSEGEKLVKKKNILHLTSENQPLCKETINILSYTII
jgi:hypothetical protein